MTREEQRAYSKGYAAAGRHAWPAHKPPLPPDEVVRGIITAAQMLFDKADSLQAGYEEDDELIEPLRCALDDFGAAMTVMTKWLVERDQGLSGEGPERSERPQ